MNVPPEDEALFDPLPGEPQELEQHLEIQEKEIGIEPVDEDFVQNFEDPEVVSAPPPAEVPVENELCEWQQVLQALANSSQQMTALLDEFREKLKYDAHKERIIDSLHAELQEYKNDLVKKHMLSVMLDVIKIIDDVRKWIRHYRALDPDQRDPRKLFKFLESIPSDLEDIFYWQGVKPFTCGTQEFDPARQRSVRRIATPDFELDKLVAVSIRCGYEWEGKVIRPEMVATYQYKESPLEAVRNSDE